MTSFSKNYLVIYLKKPMHRFQSFTTQSSYLMFQQIGKDYEIKGELLANLWN